MDVLTSETYWAWNNEIKKQVGSSLASLYSSTKMYKNTWKYMKFGEGSRKIANIVSF
jgi:hypothetical protein